MKFFEKIGFQNFLLQFSKEKEFQSQIFQKYFLQPPLFFSQNDFKHQNRKLHEGLTVLKPSRTQWQAVKVAPPPWPDQGQSQQNKNKCFQLQTRISTEEKVFQTITSSLCISLHSLLPSIKLENLPSVIAFGAFSHLQ